LDKYMEKGELILKEKENEIQKITQEIEKE
jgi:hypothetical protein